MIRSFTPIGAIAIAVAAPLAAHGVTVGTLRIGHPWARQTAPGQQAGGAFLSLTNNGTKEERLLGASTDVAARVEVHSMSMDGGVMRMRPVKGGIAIPAGQTVTLAPGGYHIMLIGLKRPLALGEMVPMTLRFARAGAVKVELKIEPVTYEGPSHAH